MSIKIVTDSTISIEQDLIDQLGITIVPLNFSIEGVIYQDGEMSLNEYLDRAEAASELPKTSQPPIGLFVDTYEKLTADGSDVISIHLSHILSGTVESARQAAMLVAGDKITVIDSEFTDQGMAYEVMKACEMVKEGKSVAEVVEAVEREKENVDLYVGVVTLENLIKGGRIGRVTGMLGGLLDLKVVMQMKNNELVSFVKGRGSKAFKKFLNEVSNGLVNSGRKIKQIGISHADNRELAQMLADGLQKFVTKPITILETNTIVATHTGRGAFAVMINYEA